MKWKNWLWGLAALPVVGVPLIAEESRPQPPATATPATATPDADTPEPVAAQPAVPEDERLSADNTLSFPVDI